jgi:hypothetical protein
MVAINFCAVFILDGEVLVISTLSHQKYHFAATQAAYTPYACHLQDLQAFSNRSTSFDMGITSLEEQHIHE